MSLDSAIVALIVYTCGWAWQFEQNFLRCVERKTVHARTNSNYELVGLPLTMLTSVASLIDWFTKGTSRMKILQVTASTLAMVSGEHVYNGDKAKRVLGYAPKPLDVVLEEIVDEMIADGLLTAKK